MTQQDPTEDMGGGPGPRTRRGSFGITGALILIVLGVFLFLANQGILGWDQWWQYFLIAAGLALVVSASTRLGGRSPRFPARRLIFGLILIGLGIMFLMGATALWPLLIIAVGLAMLVAALLRRRSPS